MTSRKWPASTAVRIIALAFKLSKMGVRFSDVRDDVVRLADSPLHQIGLKVVKSAAKGNRERGEESKRLARDHWQPRCNELIAANPRLSWNQVCQTVAQEFGFGLSTIKRHCTDPRKAE